MTQLDRCQMQLKIHPSDLEKRVAACIRLSSHVSWTTHCPGQNIHAQMNILLCNIKVYSPLGDYPRTYKPQRCFVEKFVYWLAREYRYIGGCDATSPVGWTRERHEKLIRPTNNTDVRCPVRKTQHERSQLKEGWETYPPFVCKRTGPGE